MSAEVAPCEAYFNFETDGLTVFLNGNPSVPDDLTGFSWSFGDGSTDDDHFEVSYTYAVAGTYTVCLLIWNNEADCEDDYCHTVTVSGEVVPTCEAFFVYSANGLTAVLNGTESGGSGDIVSSVWYLGDTPIGTTPVLTYTFLASGEYSICLVITTADGCTDEYCHGVVVSAEVAPCEAHFNFETEGLTVFLNGNPSVPDDLTGFSWSFGDGSTDDDHFEVSYTYAVAGTYTVCLLIWNNEADCEDDYCHTVTVSGEVVPTCEAFFVYSANGLTAVLNGTESGGSGDIVSSVWYLGDTPIGTTPVLTYTFLASGEYSICLVIATADGCTDEYCHGVVVSGIDDPCPALWVDFTYEFNANPLSVHFIKFTEGSGSGAQWLWNFGDGGTATAANPTHIYDEAGTYTVCLSVTTASGCTEQYCQSIVVSDSVGACEAVISYTLNGANAAFSAEGSSANGNIIAYSWWRGDNLFSIEPTATLHFNTSGTYNICLTIATDNGCTDEVCQSIVVSVEPPVANALAINPNIVSQYLPISLSLQTAQTVNVMLLNLQGQVAYVQQLPLEVGINEPILDLSPLMSGMYLLRTSLADGTVLTQKVLVAE